MPVWLLSLLLSAVLPIEAAPASPQARPNVLLVCVDDLKPVIGCYGDRLAKTPNLDRLAARGTRFDRAYCNQAVCAPSRNSLMTGLRPTSMGVYDLGTHFRRALPDAVTLSQAFMQHGYRAEALGKIFHVGHGNHEDPASWSVPHFQAKSIAYALPASGSPAGLTREEALFANQPADRLPRGAPFESADVGDEGYPDGRIAAEAIVRLRQAKPRSDAGTPFFLALGFLKPHLPFCAPKRYWDLYDRTSFTLPVVTRPPDGAPAYAPQFGGELRQYSDTPETGPLDPDLQRTLIHGYHAAVSYMDAQLGKVLDELDRLDLSRNTVVVLWGDHGWHLGDHGMWCKHTNYEQANRIPLIIAAPGVTRPGSHTRALAETVDIYPTLLELAGLPAPPASARLDGHSLVPQLRRPSAPGREAVFHVFPRSPRGKGPILGRAVRTARHRLVEWKKPGAPSDTAEIELYDYRRDPLETRNLAAHQPKVVERLRRLLAAQPEALPQWTANRAATGSDR